MKPILRYAAIGVMATLFGAGGYWIGKGSAHSTPGTAVSAAPAKKILYYRNPMGLPDTSPVPKKDPMGMDYVPVYADEGGAAANTTSKGKILYYRNPMGLADTSPVPKQDSMGMDYIPVYESEVGGGSQVKISPDKVQKLGVKTAVVVQRDFSRSIRAVGKVEIDERSQTVVSPRFEGWIERLHVNATGQVVSRGQPLFDVYSPDIFAAEQEYQLAVRGMKSLADASPDARQGFAALPESTARRLELLGVPDSEIARLKTGGEPRRTITYYAPVAGVVMEKMAVAGARFMPGEPLFKIADLSRVWLLLDVPENALPLARVGSPVAVSFDAYPTERFTGKVEFVYPTVNAETRTAQIRVVLPNPGNRLKPGLYAHAELTQTGATVVAVPDSAVIDSGKRQVVLVALSDGLYEPREVKTGERGDGFIAILDGLAAGEHIVVSANFLIDAESNLKAALGSMGGHNHGAQASSSGAAGSAAAGKGAPADPHAGMEMDESSAATTDHAGHGGH